MRAFGGTLWAQIQLTHFHEGPSSDIHEGNNARSSHSYFRYRDKNIRKQPIATVHNKSGVQHT